MKLNMEAQIFIDALKDLLHKQEIMKEEMEQVDKVYGENILMMKILRFLIQREELYLWLIEVLIQMVHNFFLL